jgi:hypothetical protein
MHACPGCGERLGWKRPILTRCSCGHDLAAAPLRDCDPNLLESAAWIVETVRGKERRPPGLLRDLTFAYAVELAVLTGAMLLGKLEWEMLQPLTLDWQSCLSAGYTALGASIDELDDAVHLAVGDAPSPKTFQSRIMLMNLRRLCASAKDPGMGPIAAVVDAHYERARHQVLERLRNNPQPGSGDV